jgi:hypothetical protein
VSEVVATIIDDRDARKEHASGSRCWYGGLFSGGQSSVRRKGKAGCYRLALGPVPHGPRYRVSARAKGIKSDCVGELSFSGLHLPSEGSSITCYSITLGGVGLMGSSPNDFSSSRDTHNQAECGPSLPRSTAW